MEVQNLQNINPSDVAKYYLYRAMQDGDLITPLKMQKIVYYAYVWTLVKNKKKLFNEPIQAWANGPVVPSLYQELKKYGSSPINEDFLAMKNEKEFNELIEKFPKDVINTLAEVYETYMTKTAFELVVLTHSEKPWLNARKGLAPHEQSNNSISDQAILDQHSL